VIAGKLTKSYSLLIIFLALFSVGSKELPAAELKITGVHPIELSEKPVCTVCHSSDTEISLKSVAVFNHETDWIARHRFLASKTIQLCDVCHKVSFCIDCHAYKEELKPSDKHSDSPQRWLPHRGDYIFQHRTDGRIDPTSCFRCHGRQNNATCRRCHK
jgi:hypothetical protein